MAGGDRVDCGAKSALGLEIERERLGANPRARAEAGDCERERACVCVCRFKDDVEGGGPAGGKNRCVPVGPVESYDGGGAACAISLLAWPSPPAGALAAIDGGAPGGGANVGRSPAPTPGTSYPGAWPAVAADEPYIGGASAASSVRRVRISRRTFTSSRRRARRKSSASRCGCASAATRASAARQVAKTAAW